MEEGGIRSSRTTNALQGAWQVHGKRHGGMHGIAVDPNDSAVVVAWPEQPSPESGCDTEFVESFDSSSTLWSIIMPAIASAVSHVHDLSIPSLRSQAVTGPHTGIQDAADYSLFDELQEQAELENIHANQRGMGGRMGDDASWYN